MQPLQCSSTDVLATSASVSVSDIVFKHAYIHTCDAFHNLSQIACYCSGLIGKSWAMLFVGAGYGVVLYDVVKKQVSEALVDIAQRLHALEKSGMLRGEEPAEQQSKLVTGSDDLEECLRDVIYVQVKEPEQSDLHNYILYELLCC